jgi:hypothetical protein
MKKKQIKPIKILKKPTSSLWFRFYKPETKKLNPNRKNWKKTESNRFEPVFFLKNRTETGRFGFGFFIKKFGLVTFFFIKT